MHTKFVEDFEKKLNEFNAILYTRKSIAGTVIFTVSIPMKNVPGIIVSIFLDDIDDNRVRFESTLVAEVNALKRSSVTEVLNALNTKTGILFLLEEDRITASEKYYITSKNNADCEVYQILCAFASTTDKYMVDILHTLWSDTENQLEFTKKNVSNTVRSFIPRTKQPSQESDMQFVDDMLSRITLNHFDCQIAPYPDEKDREKLLLIMDAIARKPSIDDVDESLFIKSLYTLLYSKDGYLFRYKYVRNNRLKEAFNNVCELFNIIIFEDLHENLPFN